MHIMGKKSNVYDNGHFFTFIILFFIIVQEEGSLKLILFNLTDRINLFLRWVVQKRQEVLCNIIELLQQPSRLVLENKLTVSLQENKINSNVCPGYGTKPPEDFWRMCNNHSLPLLPGPLRYEMVQTVRGSVMGQVEHFIRDWY